MYPILFSIGPITVYSYGLMLAVAFILASSLASRRAYLFNITKDSMAGLAFTLLIFGLIGARALYVLLNIRYFSTHPFEALLINRGGLVFYGGFLLATLAGILYARIQKFSIQDAADLIIPFVALGQAIGRIGCFLNGCCYGRPTSSVLGMVFPYTKVRVYPTQLFSSAGLLIVFGLLFYMQSKRKFKGQILYLYFIIYGIFRFAMDFLRGDLQVFFFGLTVTQLMSLALAVTGLMLMTFLNGGDRSPRRSLDKEDLSPKVK